jgi:poly(A) polymerase/tRNA nucleotidyltransferase (CCA-adding enzyme)
MLISKEVKFVIGELKKKGFEAYIVGGCVRDFLRGVPPKDWDVATSARPGEIQKIFPKSFYENRFLTVTVQTSSSSFNEPSSPQRARVEDENKVLIANVREIEVTTFRSEAKYTDKRHPDEIKFAKTLEEDLGRRDFTVNAIAMKISEKKSRGVEVIDPFGGKEDLKKKIIRAVGSPEERFSEDALRMMRAIRFAATLNFKIEEETAEAIKNNSSSLRAISQERVRDELMKIIMTERAMEGIELLRQLNLLKYIIPELEEGYGTSQNKHHIYECYEHYLRSFDYAVKNNFNKYVRLAALFHDIGKPRAKRGEGKDATFYGHEIIGARMTAQILGRLKFPKKEIEKIVRLVRYHLFYYNVGEVSESSVRRLVLKVGPEDMEELLQLRMADRVGSGVPKAEPYKLRHLKYVIEKVAQDPISAKMLKTSGNDVMKILKIKPGPRIGQILDVLLGLVLQDPKKNKKEFLNKEIQKLGKLSAEELSSLVGRARKEREEITMKRDEMTKKKYWVT